MALTQKVKTHSLFLLSMTIFCLLLSVSKSDKKHYTSPRFNNYTKAVNIAFMSLESTARLFKNNKTSIDTLKQQVTAARLAYKKIEFYLAFYHTDYVNSHINGAPLLHIERTGTQPEIVEPEGLQVLDELIFSEEVTEERNKIYYLTTKLRNSYTMLYERLKIEDNFKNPNVLAMRMELIRLFTLGLTGFDTPGSLNAIPEAEVVLQAMKGFIEDNPKNKTSKNLIPVFESAITYLQNHTVFEDFDRLYFYKNHLQPIYSGLANLQSKQEDTENLKYTSSWNPDNNHMFSDDFLNPYFFTELKEDENNIEIVALGKQLFNDPILSNDQSLSCVSCHNPNKAFTDNQPKSFSNVQGKTVLRNAPTLLNSVYADRYFYDLRAFTLEQQVEHVIFNSKEFNTSYTSILEKLNTSNDYKAKIKSAFGKETLQRDGFVKSLAAYVMSLRSYNSTFDKYMRSETSTIEPRIKDGFNLFMGKANCATCHFAPTFSGLVPPFFSESESEILGVPKDPKDPILTLDADEGRYDNLITSENAWIYRKSFKTPTVRNIELTAPYFHNGAYETLEDVIDFYEEGGGEGLGLSVSNQTLSADKLNLTDYEKDALIAFLKSLNDAPKDM
ncbi:cytochrome-c peroxidase [Flavivirga sp. 57AJ16]|uniref:cytochrome-c peroxidase n=1 Tax=Flavivirga sp. 57AJ16 TaxID=3025307 RepID=UPI0023672EC9|nr:cytochrome c peroxidase [Flavivirga sp. 57AJ16]MDD7887564.1 cytochrome c peroxidase [Flavivirga sp. 57AJ16]